MATTAALAEVDSMLNQLLDIRIALSSGKSRETRDLADAILVSASTLRMVVKGAPAAEALTEEEVHRK